MKRILTVFKALTLASLKRPALLFWTIVFPTILFVILALVFSNLQKSVNVRMALVNESASLKDSKFDLASYVVNAFDSLAKPQKDKTPLLTLTKGKNVNRYLTLLKDGKLDAIVVIPKHFNTYAYFRMLHLKVATPTVTAYVKKNSQSSHIAFSIIQSVFSTFNKELWKKVGVKYFSIKTTYVKEGNDTFSYANFLVPGIVIMLLLTVSLFEVTDDLLVQRERKVLRRLFVTPLKKNDYIVGVVLSNFTLNVARIVIFLSVASIVGAKFTIDWYSVTFMIYAFVTTIPLGFFVAALAKSANDGNAIANLLNFLFMFLGGLYFPIGNSPSFIKWIAYSIPTTYLANGLREAMKVSVSPTPTYLNFLVPLLWAFFMFIYSSLKFKWEA